MLVVSLNSYPEIILRFCSLFPPPDVRHWLTSEVLPTCISISILIQHSNSKTKLATSNIDMPAILAGDLGDH